MADPRQAIPIHQGQGTTPDAIPRLVARYRTLWFECPNDTLMLGPATGRWARHTTYRAARRLIDELASQVKDYPDNASEQRTWKTAIQNRIQIFGESRLGWPHGYRDLLFADNFYDTTVDFVRRARSLDESLLPEEIGQALRNVWIVNSLQMLLARPVELTPAVFAYSLLYPYTDNFLDDTDVPADEKWRASQRLQARLSGDQLEPASKREERIHQLVEIIEAQYPRSLWPQVYHSLLAIHHAQCGSLAQQEGTDGSVEADVLGVSIEKGGTSVLADGYLAAGELSASQADFCFAYGVFLQLLDDLQDVRSDLEAGHRTIFSQTVAAWPLDRLTSRLYHFVHRCLEASCFSGPDHAQKLDLIRRNCVALLVGAVSENARLFSRRFVKTLESGWPLGFGAMRRLRRRVDKRREHVAKHLRRRLNVDSLFDLL